MPKENKQFEALMALGLSAEEAEQVLKESEQE